MANPFASSPFATNTFSSSGARKGSDELGPDEIAPGEVAPSSTNYSPFGQFSSPFSKGRRSTELGPDEIAPGISAFNPSYQTPTRRSTELGPDEIAPGQIAPTSPAYQTPQSAGNRRSTNIAPDEAPTFYSAPSTPWRTPGDRRSTNIGPDEVVPTTDAIAKPSPAYKTYTPADRKSTNASSQEIPPSSPFSRPSYGSPSAVNRRSTNIGPDDVSSSQPSVPAWRKFAKRMSSNIGPDESAPGESTLPLWNTPSPGDRRSTNIGPHELGSVSSPGAKQPFANNSAAGGAVDANPFATSTDYFAPKPSILKATSADENASTESPEADSRSSRNFSKKLSNIMIPENGTFIDDIATPKSAPIVDSAMQTPVKGSFSSAYEQKKSRPNSVAFTGLTSPLEKKSRPNSVAFNDMPSPLERKSSMAPNSRRTSNAGPPSTMNGRRASVGVNGPRRSSVSVTNVVIPAHLMTHVETNWNEDKIVGRRKSAFQREDSRKSFNIQSMAQQQQEEIKNIINTTPQAPRHMSESMEALSKADPFASTRDSRKASARKSRGKSLAAVSEHEKPDEEEEDEDEDEEAEEPSPDEKPEGLTPWGKFSFAYRDGGVSPGAAVDPADPMAAAGAALKDNATANTESVSAEPPRRKSMWRQSFSVDPNAPYNGERRGTIFQRAGSVFQDTLQNVRKKVRRSSMWDVYENAKKRQLEIRRKRWVQIVFEYSFYFMLIALLYFLIIGVPLWKGTYWELYLAFKYKLNATGTWSVVIAVAVAYAYSPLFVLFEPDPPMPEEPFDPTQTPNVADTALMIPCYKAASLIGATLEAATKVFPPSHIFVVANGNSPTPLDDTEEVCRPYGVNHIWSPVGSKIVAQFVGCYAAKDFKNVLLIDDDCALPPNFPIVSDRLKGKVMCMGYTIKSVGPLSSKGTLCQQAQDLEYKISGIQRALAGKIGSATFPHGAISLWDREFLIKTFSKHPGFSVSEDWFFGHVARQLGCRTQMATSVFIETETPPAVFFSSGGSRGGFGEMTVFKQRFLRWNFFFVNGMYYNLHYILFSWELGWWELGTKLFVFQEIYETLLYLATPIVVPVSLVVRPQFFFELMALTFVLYMGNAVIFNEIHLRRKNEKVPWKCVWLYYMPYKLVLTFVNVASCYYAIYKYATYFANRHPKIIEDDKAVNVVLQLEEEDVDDDPVLPVGGRRMSVTAVGSQVDVPGGAPGGRRMTITAMGQRFSNPDITITEEDEEETEELIEKPERRASISIVKTGEAPAPFEARRPSITVDGRRVSVGSATVIDDVPASKTRRTSDAFQSKGVSTSPAKPAGRRSSDAFQSKGVTEGSTFAQAARRRMSSAKGSVVGVTSVLEEEEEEGDSEKKVLAASDVESKRRSKRKSQLRQSYIAPMVEITESEVPAVPELPVVDDRLLNRISAIEEALAARGIGAVDFAIHDDNAGSTLTATVEENEDVVSIVSEPEIVDEKKHADAKSMV
ncbi:hypothetical protein D6C78_03146 [Aureobasidium pullulans]|uniref:Uncharacterized protein n=1 Tax=Aureobasidium pullulans TaxID=5580 RepID=A0A4T0BXB3_AURPU|nr:hypothetical protein D6C78_03146 [Aureobasidium pullulans]